MSLLEEFSTLLKCLHDARLVVVHGADLADACDPAWLAAIEHATVVEKQGLLHVSVEDAARAVQEHRAVIVFERDSRAFVACVFLGFIAEGWYELGTVYVVPQWRYRTTGLPISQVLHHAALELADVRGWDVSETSTVPAILHGVARNGVELASFDDLPEDVKLPTCCCPAEKTGAPAGLKGEALHAWNATSCTARNTICRLMLSPRTAERVALMRAAAK